MSSISSNSTLDKEKALDQLKLEMKKTWPEENLVFGEGNVNARLAFVGEAPGREEEAQGRVFVGLAGRLLNQVLADVSLNRAELWLTNGVKWRTTELRRGRSFSRGPNPGEVRANKVWLERELEVVKPDVVLCLGELAAREVIGNSFRMRSQHGLWYRGLWGVEALATFHPSYILRWGRREQLITWLREDILRVKSKYDEFNSTC